MWRKRSPLNWTELKARGVGACLCLLLSGTPLWAEKPLSAIDWLSNSVQQPSPPPGPDPSVSDNALHDNVTVSHIDGPRPDAVGLLPVSVTGLPPDLWVHSRPADISARLQQDRPDLLPALQGLYYRLLLAELDAPPSSTREPQMLLARIDSLLALGALEQAEAMLKRTKVETPELFRRAFDIALLLRNEEQLCDQLRNAPALSPTFTARIYCLARSGDWSGAALSYETGRALGYVNANEDLLLTHFLDLGLEDEVHPLPFPTRPSPLEFRIYESIGRPLSTVGLPRAFAHADLHSSSGWKAKLEAAERLASTGAIDPNQLMGLYFERRPAASGGTWDRARALQALDGALAASGSDLLGQALATAWDEMVRAELELPFARHICPKLERRNLTGAAGSLKLRICLLAGIAPEPGYVARNHEERFLVSVANGTFDDIDAKTPTQTAIIAGFGKIGVPARLRSLMNEHRQGEAILRAMEMFQSGALGDHDELSDAIQFLRSVGLEEIARQAVIEHLILDRRG